MSIKDKYEVRPIPQREAEPWILEKHYAHRLPMVMEFTYGLFNIKEKILKGVCVFGPTAPTVPLTIFGNYNYKVRELTRLIIDDNCEKNTGSFFISNCFKLLPTPMCLVSFADANMNHHGYIYQATNWIYTGEGGHLFFYIDENKNEIHNLTIGDRMKKENINSKQEYIEKHNIKKEKSKPKYRYIYFLGDKREKKQMLKDFKLQQLPYPKGDNKNYDTSEKIPRQQILF